MDSDKYDKPRYVKLGIPSRGSCGQDKQNIAWQGTDSQNQSFTGRLYQIGGWRRLQELEYVYIKMAKQGRGVRRHALDHEVLEP